MQVTLMIEGQEDVTWEEWVAIADTCEETGIETLMRSDHYLSVGGALERGSLDAWATINALAACTTTLRLGTLVSPASFRHPAILAKLATTADHVSDGRIELGLGTGWSESEHSAFGFPFHPMKERMDVLEEQLEIVRGLWGPGPFSFAGRHYTLTEIDALPKPVQRPHPALIMGGQAGPRSLRLAVRHADEYNVLMIPPQRAGELAARIADACRAAGREPMPVSLMTPSVVAVDETELRERIAALAAATGQDLTLGSLPEHFLAGTVEQVAERLGEYAAAGISRIYFQDLLHRDLDQIELLGRELRPAVAGL